MKTFRPRTMSSPVKKTPVMGVSSTAVRRPQSAATTTMPTTSVITNTSAVMPLSPDLEQLEAAIQSMNGTFFSLIFQNFLHILI